MKAQPQAKAPANPGDRRRLHRSVEYQHPDKGVYSTADSMHEVTKVGRKWKHGVKQPQGGYDYSKSDTYKSLKSAQDEIDASEEKRPRSTTMQTPYNDRRRKK